MKIIACASMSLDGFIADATGSCDWILPEDDKIWQELALAGKAVIVGRHTFDQYYGTIYPLAAAMSYVMTTAINHSNEDDMVTYVPGGPLEVMRTLAADGRPSGVLVGGGEAYGSFAAANLIDELWVSVYPLVLGDGIKLFGSYKGKMKLDLQQGYALPGGVVHNRYLVG